MKEIWTLIIKTQLTPAVRAFYSFSEAKYTLRQTLKKLAFKNNSMFDGEGKITNLRWMDNDRPLEHTQMSGTLMMHASGYPYGTNMVVRVAVADVEE